MTYRGRTRLTVPSGNTSIDLPQNLFLIRASNMIAQLDVTAIIIYSHIAT